MPPPIIRLDPAHDITSAAAIRKSLLADISEVAETNVALLRLLPNHPDAHAIRLRTKGVLRNLAAKLSIPPDVLVGTLAWDFLNQ